MADVFHVRTLFSLGDTFQWMAPNLSKFSVLRVLLLECSGKRNNGYFKGLAHLHYLKYLGLRSDGVKTKHLEEIKGLKHLETLDLRGTSIRELPASIVQLKKLKHLITERVVMFPDGIGDLVSLQQLEWLEARESLMAELGNLTGLRVLKIYGLHDDDESCVKTFLQSLSNLHNIHALYINCHYDWSCSLDCIPYKWSAPPHLQQVDGHLSKVPRLFSSLSELSCLSIMVHSLSQDDLQPLGSLPVLRFLDLNVNWWGIAEERLVIGTDQPFRAITDFKFEHRTRCWLVFCSGVMPKLERLDLYFEAQKREGGGFDVGLQNLTSKVIMDCDGARITEVDDIEAKCRDTIDKHPNRPTLELSRKYEWLMRNEESLKDQPTTLEMRL